MKKFIFIITAIMSAVASFAQGSDDNVMYVYRNDGGFEAFNYSEVDSMTYSNMDVNGYSYDDIVTQEIWTKDSLYRIPLAAIDSIGFSTPPTIINQDVFVFTSEHDQYLLDTSTLTFTMKASTPKDMRPSKDNIVVSDISCMSFQYGIIARVVNVTETGLGYKYECEQAGLDDVYDQLVCYYGEQTEETQSTRATGNDGDTFTIDLWNIPFEKKWTPSGTTFGISANDKGYMTMKICKLATKDLYAEFGLYNDFYSSIDFNAEVKSSLIPEPYEFLDMNIGRIPTPVPLIWIVPKLNISGYLELKGKAALDFSAHFNRHDAIVFKYQDNKWTITNKNDNNVDTGVDVAKLSLDGSAEYGIKPEIMLSINGSETGLGLNARYGIKHAASFYFDALKYFDTGVYDAIKESQVTKYSTQQLSAFAEIGLYETIARGELNIAKSENEIDKRYFVPTFTEQYQQDGDDGTRRLYLSINNDVVFPMNISMGLYDKNDELIYEVNDGDIYDGTFHDYLYSFSNLNAYPGCKAYPIIRFGEIEMRATPAIEMSCPAKLDKAELVQAYYNPDDSESPNVFTNLFTATLEDATDVVEWGLYSGDRLFPFDEITNRQSKVLIISVPNTGNTIRADFSNFVFEVDSRIGVYVKKHYDDGSTKIIRSPYEDYTVRYDTKPSFTMSNPILTGTTVIDTSTDQDGNTIYRYRTDCQLDVKIDGGFWIDYIDKGISRGNLVTNDPWTPQRDMEYQAAAYSNYWSNSDTNHTLWCNLHLRNNPNTITSNFLNWYGGIGNITGVDVSSTPMFSQKPRNQTAGRRTNKKLRNYVDDEYTDLKEKQAEILKEITKYPVIRHSDVPLPINGTKKQ